MKRRPIEYILIPEEALRDPIGRNGALTYLVFKLLAYLVILIGGIVLLFKWLM